MKSFYILAVIFISVFFAFYSCGRRENTILSPWEDPETPKITLVGNDHVYLGNWVSWTELGYTAIDNIDGDITSNVSIEQIDRPDNWSTKNGALYVYQYKVTDSDGFKCPPTFRNVEYFNIQCSVDNVSNTNAVTNDSQFPILFKIRGATHVYYSNILSNDINVPSWQDLYTNGSVFNLVQPNLNNWFERTNVISNLSPATGYILYFLAVNTNQPGLGITNFEWVYSKMRSNTYTTDP
jgi:hypothetical protein